MKIQGRCYIAKKYKSEEKEITNRGTIAYGKLTWSDTIKAKDGAEYKSYTYKDFVCFGGNIETMYSCRNDWLEIEGILKSEKYTDKEGKERFSEKVYIQKVHIVQKGAETPRSSANAYQKDQFDEIADQYFPSDLEIPF